MGFNEQIWHIRNVVDKAWGVQTGQCISWCDHNKDITNPLLFIINPTDSDRCLYFIRLSLRKQCKLDENNVSENEKSNVKQKFLGKKCSTIRYPLIDIDKRDFDWQHNKSPHFTYFPMYTQFGYDDV